MGRRGRGTIPVAPIREYVLEHEVNLRDLALRLGFMDRRGRVDSTRLKRRLGLKPYYTHARPDGSRQLCVTELLTEKVAVELVLALDLLPSDFDF